MIMRLRGKNTLVKAVACVMVWMLAANLSFGQVYNVNTQLSYYNVTKASKGPISTSDILEIRAVISVGSSTLINGVSFTGAIPVGTSYIPGTLAAKTNEGLTTVTNTGVYTDAAGDDRGTFYSASQTLRINIGQNATASAGGAITGGMTVPRFYSSATIIQATFRVKVNVPQGTVISLSGNTFSFNGSTYTLPTTSIYISYPNECGSMDPVNYITVESNGTFGSGTSQNRSASAYATGFSYVNIGSGAPQDGQYSVVKNTSYNSSTGKVHSVWDIFGDHSGSSDGTGNPAPSATTSGGYMLLVNATYTPSAVFNYTLTNLTQNIDYTMAFWVRNVCGSCAANPSTGGGGTGPGVLPNLIFSVDGTDRYTTSTVSYSQNWEYHSFTFNSGNQTSANVVIKNNAPGGGGNDWAIDDIGLYQCLVILSGNILGFTAERLDNEVLLKWNVAARDNIDSYTVEYSEDGRKFTALPGSRMPSGQTQYIFKDTRELKGSIYYRIVSRDKDGKRSYSETKLVKVRTELRNGMDISMANASGGSVISIQSTSRMRIHLRVMDASGRVQASMSANVSSGANMFQLNKLLPKGIYVILAEGDGGTVASRKVLLP